jgi:drug/metabolite transporter (DMT)-like permease
MMDSFLFLIQWIRIHPEAGGMIALGSLGLVVIYAGILVVAVTRMSPDYFSSPTPAPGTLRYCHPVLSLALKTFKTILGVALLLAGVAMIVLPGQGLLTIVIAIGFLEFPGKRRLMTAIVRHDRIMNALNRIRHRAGKEPLLAPDLRHQDQ